MAAPLEVCLSRQLESKQNGYLLQKVLGKALEIINKCLQKFCWFLSPLSNQNRLLWFVFAMEQIRSRFIINSAINCPLAFFLLEWLLHSAGRQLRLKLLGFYQLWKSSSTLKRLRRGRYLKTCFNLEGKFSKGLFKSVVFCTDFETLFKLISETRVIVRICVTRYFWTTNPGRQLLFCNFQQVQAHGLKKDLQSNLF